MVGDGIGSGCEGLEKQDAKKLLRRIAFSIGFLLIGVESSDGLVTVCDKQTKNPLGSGCFWQALRRWPI